MPLRGSTDKKWPACGSRWRRSVWDLGKWLKVEVGNWVWESTNNRHTCWVGNDYLPVNHKLYYSHCKFGVSIIASWWCPWNCWVLVYKTTEEFTAIHYNNSLRDKYTSPVPTPPIKKKWTLSKDQKLLSLLGWNTSPAEVPLWWRDVNGGGGSKRC